MIPAVSRAQVMVMEGDAETVASGAGGKMPPVKVDRVLREAITSFGDFAPNEWPCGPQEVRSRGS
jgi:hypothetical protein